MISIIIGSCIPPKGLAYVSSSSSYNNWLSNHDMDIITCAYLIPRSAALGHYKLNKRSRLSSQMMSVQKIILPFEYSPMHQNDTENVAFKSAALPSYDAFSFTRPLFSNISNGKKIQSILSKDAITVGFLWLVSSAFLSTWANTTFIKKFKDPVLHSFVRFFGAALFSLFSLITTGQVQSLAEITQISRDVIKPALFLWLANYSNSCALQMSGITLTYAVKACIPVFTVLICSSSGQYFPPAIFAALVPICLGVALASISDLDFKLVGLAAAMVSAVAQTLLNLSIKTVRQKTRHTGPQAFMGMSLICTLATLPLMAMSPTASQAALALRKLTSMADINLVSILWPALLIVVTAVAYYLEYVLNFTFVGFVRPVTFSVSDIVRRVAIIATGAVVFHKPLSAMNAVGIAVALGGVLAYSLVEYRTGMADKHDTTLAAANNNSIDESSSDRGTEEGTAVVLALHEGAKEVFTSDSSVIS